jgi:hypothetical protein
MQRLELMHKNKNDMNHLHSQHKTILDYGAKLYLTKQDAINGESCHNAIQNMLDEVGMAILPPYGWLKNEETTILWKDYDMITTPFGKVNMISTKPISMFLPLNRHQTIQGFRAWYVGPDIVEECAVTRLGGDSRNIGAENHSIDTGITRPHYRNRRTNSVNLTLNYDFVGDARYYTKRGNPNSKHYNDFIQNGNAHGLWINYDEPNEDEYSHCHGLNVKGDWTYINTGIKIKRKFSTQSINTIDANVKIWGARKFIDVNDVNFCKFKIMGQESRMINLDEDVDVLNITDCDRIMSDIFVFDVGAAERKKRKGIYKNVKRLEFVDYAKIHAYNIGDEYKLAAMEFVNCEFKDSERFRRYVHELSERNIYKLNRQLINGLSEENMNQLKRKFKIK